MGDLLPYYPSDIPERLYGPGAVVWEIFIREMISLFANGNTDKLTLKKKISEMPNDRSACRGNTTIRHR